MDMKDLFKRYWPYFSFFALVIVFFWKFFLKGQLPIPGDFVVGTYFPWLDYKWGGYGAGVPVKNPLLADVPSLIYPLRVYAMDLLRDGIFPLWNNLQFGGYPLMANFQTAVFNPFNILFFIFKDYLAWSIQVMLQPLLILSFTYIFLRQIGLKRFSSVFGSVVFAFSGFNTVWLTYNVHGFVASTFPLLLYFADKLIIEGKRHWGVLFSITLGIQIFFGYPQLTLYAIALVGLWTILRNFRKVPTIAFFGFLGLLLASIQLIPGYELLSNSQRVVEGVSGGEGVAFLPYTQLVSLLAPDFFGNPTTYNYWGPGNYTNTVIYSGIVGLLLALITLISFKKNKVIFYFGILFFCSLLLALPNPLSKAIFSSGFLGLGAATATRILVLFNFSVAVLCAFGIELVEKIKSPKYWRVFLYTSLIISSIFLGLLYSYLLMKGEIAIHPEYMDKKLLGSWVVNIYTSMRNLAFPFVVSVLLLTFFTLWKKFKIGLSKYLILILATTELFRFGWKFTPYSESLFLFPKTPVFDKLDEFKDEKFRISEGDTIPISMWIPYRLESYSGYDAVYPLRVAKYIGVANSSNPKAGPAGRYGSFENPVSPLYDLANVRYVLALKRDKIGVPDTGGTVSYKYPEDKFKKVFEDGSVAILENIKASNRIFFVSDWEVIGDDVEAFDYLLDPINDLTKSVVLDKDFLRFDKSDDPPNYEINNSIFEPDKLSLSITSDSDGFLVVTNTFYPGWDVYVDGKKEEIFVADTAFMAVPISKGIHNLEFIYHPKSFRIGGIVSLGSLLVLLAILISDKINTNGYKKNS
jgi:hypothetical protein